MGGNSGDEPARHSIVVCQVADDREYGCALAAQLDGAGLPVWTPGDDHFSVTRRRLRHAVAVVVLMSPESQASPDITRMILEGQLRGRPFLPILLHGERDYHLANTWYVDARDGRLLGPAELEMLRELHRADVEHRTIDPLTVLPAALVRPAVSTVRVPTVTSLDRLAGYLSKGDIEYADLLTTALLLEAGDRSDAGWLRRRDGERLPLDLLAALADLWGRHTNDRQGFAAQLDIAAIAGDLHAHFLALSIAYGWRDTADDDVLRDYPEFARRAGHAGFFPTLRNPQFELHQDWYDTWTATTIAVHLRLREWTRS